MILSKNLPKSLDELVQDMQLCEQSKGFSVLQHGEAVRYNLLQLKNILNDNTNHNNWRIPNCVFERGCLLINNLYDSQTIDFYTTYHDCGKPYCLQIDETGKRHFPNHAEVSSIVWKTLMGDNLIAKLMYDDMVFHVCSSEELDKKLQNEWSIKDASTLFLTALAEIHANGVMFGGLESVSFKMKYKQLERRGKQMCKFLFTNL